MKNTTTALLLKTLNILFLYNVTGTAIGSLVGFFLLSLQQVIEMYIPFFGLIKWYGFVIFGILIFNVKPMVKKEYVDPRIETKLRYVREILEEADFSEKEKRAIWKKVIESVSNELSESTNILNVKDNFNGGATN